jgi:hypothetical protein
MLTYAQIFSNSLFSDHHTIQYFNGLCVGTDDAVTITLPNTFFDSLGLLDVAIKYFVTTYIFVLLWHLTAT